MTICYSTTYEKTDTSNSYNIKTKVRNSKYATHIILNKDDAAYQAISVRIDIKTIEDPNSIIHSFIALRYIGIPSTFAVPDPAEED